MVARARAVALTVFLCGARGMRDSYLAEELAALGVSDDGDTTTTGRADEKVGRREPRPRSRSRGSSSERSSSPSQRPRASSDEKADLARSLEALAPGSRLGWSFSSEDEEVVSELVRKEASKARKRRAASKVDEELRRIWDSMKKNNKRRRRAMGLEYSSDSDDSDEESEKKFDVTEEQVGGLVVNQVREPARLRARKQTRRHDLVPLEDPEWMKEAKETASAQRPAEQLAEQLAQEAAMREDRQARERKARERAEKLAQDPSRLLVHAVSFNVANGHSREDQAWRDMLERISQGHEKADLAVFGFQEFDDRNNFQFAEMARQRLWKEVSSERLEEVAEDLRQASRRPESLRVREEGGPPQARPSGQVLEEALRYLREVLEKKRDFDEDKLAELLEPVIDWLGSVLQKPDEARASYPNLAYDEVGERRIGRFKKKFEDLKATQKHLEEAIEHMRKDATDFVTVQDHIVRYQANTKNSRDSYNPANVDNIKHLRSILGSMLDVNPEIPKLGPGQVAVRLEKATFQSGLACHFSKHFDTNLYVFVNPWSKWSIKKEEYHSKSCETDGKSQGCSINNGHGSECGKVVNLLVFKATRTVAAQIEVEVKFCVLNTHMSFKHDAHSRMTYIYNALREAQEAGCTQVVFVGDFNSRSHCQLPQSLPDMTVHEERWSVTDTRLWARVYQRSIYEEAKSSTYPFNEHKSTATGGTSLQYVLAAFATGKPHWEGKSRYSFNSAHALAGPFELADELTQLTTSEMVTCWEHDTEARTSLAADARKDDVVIELDLRFDEGLQATPLTTTVTALAEKGDKMLTVQSTDDFSDFSEKGDAVTICAPSGTCQKTRIELIIEGSARKRFPRREAFPDRVDPGASSEPEASLKMALSDRLAMDCPSGTTIVDESKTRKVRPGVHLELKSSKKDQTRTVKSVDIHAGMVTLDTPLREPLSSGDTVVVQGPKAPRRFENSLLSLGPKLKEGVVDFGPTYKLSKRKPKEEGKKTKYCFQAPKAKLTALAKKGTNQIVCNINFDVGDEIKITDEESEELHTIQSASVNGAMVLESRLQAGFPVGSEVAVTKAKDAEKELRREARKKCYGNSDRKGKHNPAWTDRVLVTGDAEVLFYDAINLGDFDSDHAPVVATVSIKAEG